MAPYEIRVAADCEYGVGQFGGCDLENPAPVIEAIVAQDIDDLYEVAVIVMKVRATLSIVHHSLQLWPAKSESSAGKGFGNDHASAPGP